MRFTLRGNEAFRRMARREKLALGQHRLAFPSRLAASGPERLAESRRLLGARPEIEAELLKRFGSYELDSGLVQSLRLRGLDLPANGECRHLSPSRWLEEVPTTDLWASEEILRYLEEENARIQEIFVPRWVMAFASYLRLEEDPRQVLAFCEFTLAHLEPEILISAEK